MKEGIVIAHYGDKVVLQEENLNCCLCHLRQNLPALVVGDQVSFLSDELDPHQGVVIAHFPRQQEMWRYNQQGKKKLIAANIDQMLIVACPDIKRSEEVIDRYLILGELQKIACLIVLNKMDLLSAAEKKEKQAFYETYQKIGYPVLETSTLQANCKTTLFPWVHQKNSVLVGLSGVGKSSLVQSLVPEETLKIAEAAASEFGQHTTTTSRWYLLEKGGALIDSPGIRKLNLDDLSAEQITHGFKEFKPYWGHCQFRNCSHQPKEQGCALTEAAKAGHISAARWSLYQKLCVV